MCGRFEPVTLAECEQIATSLQLQLPLEGITLDTNRPADAFPRRNAPIIACTKGPQIPTQTGLPASSTSYELIQDTTPLQTLTRQWGFLPTGITDAVFNTRIETAANLPLWKDAYANGRCLVAVRAYFEPHGTERGIRPDTGREVAQLYRFSAQEASIPVLLLAGVYNERYFSITTCAPDELMRPIHNRMPIALTPDDAHTWLSADFERITHSSAPLTAAPFYPTAPRYDQLSLF